MTSLALAPTAYGYAVATVELTAQRNCDIGGFPFKSAAVGSSTLAATPDTCDKMPIKESWLTGSEYTVNANAITDDASYGCRGVGVYTDGQCSGEPYYVLPFKAAEREARGVCLPDVFHDFVGVKLLCDGH